MRVLAAGALRLLAIVLALALGAVACGSDSGSDDAVTTTDASAQDDGQSDAADGADTDEGESAATNDVNSGD